MKIYLVIILFFCTRLFTVGQEMLGVVNSNYAGIYGISLNPASMVGSRLYMDYNLISLQSSFINNYAYLESGDYIDYVFYGILPVYYTTENEERNYTIYRSNTYYSGYINQRAMGPAAMIVDGKHAYGLTTALRTNTSFHNLPNDIGGFLYEAIDYDVQHGITYTHDKDIRVGSLSWFEINFSYAYNFKRYKWESMTAGITVKPLLGIMGTYSNVYDVTYQVHNDTLATVYDATFDYAYSIPVDYNTSDFQKSPAIKGFGLGFDLGFVYAKTTKGHGNNYYSRLCEQKYEAYNYKIGISLIDMGYIRFTKKAGYKNYINTSTEWFKPADTLPTTTVNEITAKVESYFQNNSEEVIENNDFVMNLPPALCIQYDRTINNYFFINGTLIYGFSLGKSYVKRPSQLVIAPRIETARLEVSIPISISEWYWTSPQIGLAIRYGNFFVGSDKINSIFGLTDFRSFDLYCGLRLNLSNLFGMNYIKELCDKRKIKDIEMFDFRNF